MYLLQLMTSWADLFLLGRGGEPGSELPVGDGHRDAVGVLVAVSARADRNGGF